MPKTTEEWTPPTVPPLPDNVLQLKGDALDAVALERCRARGDTQGRDRANGNRPMACRRCLTEVILGRELSPTRDLEEYQRQVPLPDKATDLHRRLLRLLVQGGRMDLAKLCELTGASETNCSARLRDLRQWGYPIGRKIEAGRPIYWLAA